MRTTRFFNNFSSGTLTVNRLESDVL